MIFVCPCGEKYTIPMYDELTKRDVCCDCGNHTEEFELMGRDLEIPSF